MRSNRNFSFREKISAIRKVFSNQLSIAYLKIFGAKSIMLVRDGGLGDCIMSTIALEELVKKYPDSKLIISSNFPDVFASISSKKHSILSFPALWLTYGHYDIFPWSNRSNIHYSQMIAKAVNVSIGKRVQPKLITSDAAEFIKYNQLEEPYFVIQPYAGNWFPEKNWERSKWVQLVNRLVEKGARIFQIGTAEEPYIDGAIDFRGKTSVEESLIIIKKAQLVVGVNSFAEQAAWAFDVPGVFLYGPTNPICSLNPNQIAVFGTQLLNYEEIQSFDYQFHRMEEIGIDTVWKAINKFNLPLK